MRDTVFLGPMLVIPFNWAFSHVIAFVPPDTLPRYLLLFAMWVAGGARGAAAGCRALAAHFDRRAIVIRSAHGHEPATAHQNRLARETSPYLLQHQHNPVDWWPWGPEALAEAKRTGKPILLSVGYAACHWCHVMAHESFEDEPTAAVMNELFVNIKVDREERPDIDQIYMNALHLLGEQGGWPLTMFLTPAGEPVWGGTYFPKTARYGRAGLRRRAARDRAAVPRGAGPHRQEPRRPDGAARREGARPPARSWSACAELDRAANGIARAIDPTMAACAARRNFRNARSSNCSGAPALRAPPEEDPTAPRRRLLRPRAAHARAHLRGRHLRSSRRRLLALFGRRALARAALREDALRQRAAARAARASRMRRTGMPLYRERARETVGWLAREMTTPGGRVLGLARRRFGRRGGQVLRLVARRDRCRRSGPRTARFLQRNMT